MVSSYLAVLVAVAAAIATTHGKAGDRCCTQPQWESSMGQIGGYHEVGTTKAGPLLNAFLESYDAKGKRIAIRSVTAPNKIIWDFKAKREYLIAGAKCTYTKLPQPFTEACIPAGAKYFGSSYMGGGKSKTFIDTWMFPVQHLNVIFSNFVDGMCIPASQTWYGRSGNFEFIQLLGFSNYTSGIQDPKVFDPPAGCRPAHYKGKLHFEKVHLSMPKPWNVMKTKHNA